MRRWLLGGIVSLGAAGLLFTSVSAQEATGGKPAEDERRDDGDVRAERLVRTLGGPHAQIGVTIADLGAGASPARGAKVEDVEPDSPASTAGIQAGDVITGFDGERVRSARQLARLVSETPAGLAVDVTVMRDGRQRALTVTPERQEFRFGDRSLAPGFPAAPHFRFDRADPQEGRKWFERFHPYGGSPGRPGRGRLGVVAQPLSPQLAEYFGTKGGVLVATVRDDSPAARAGLRAGDVITAVDGQKVESPADLARATAQVEGGDVGVSYVRDRKSAEATVALPARERPRDRTRPV